jgi:GR25 family glycosyltransferase involved in LPS biosynthesis
MSLGTRFDDRAPIPLCLPVSEALKKLNETQEGVGTDGYLITPHGARKMLEAVRLDLCFGHVDWRVLHYSVKLELLDKDFAGTRVERVLKHDINKHRPPRWGILNSFVLSSPLIYEKGIGSSRARANEEALQETLC